MPLQPLPGAAASRGVFVAALVFGAVFVPKIGFRRQVAHKAERAVIDAIISEMLTWRGRVSLRSSFVARPQDTQDTRVHSLPLPPPLLLLQVSGIRSVQLKRIVSLLSFKHTMILDLISVL